MGSAPFTRAALAAGLLAGCQQVLGLTSPTLQADAPVVPASCPTLAAECVGDVLRACTVVGEAPIDTTCAWGCSTTASPHCAKLLPAGGGVTPTDLDPHPDLESVVLGAAILSTNDGSIIGVRQAGIGIKNGIGFVVRNNVAIFTFANLTIDGVLFADGSNAVALVASGDITVNALIDVIGNCIGIRKGPGGAQGGSPESPGDGLGGGTAGAGSTDDSSGGAGGGHSAMGGAGGKSDSTTNPPGGAAYGDPKIMVLTGGSGGGGGGGAGGGAAGGGGGGAIQLAANGMITIAAGINAGGCGGGGGPNMESGGGGGAGGAILIEASTVILTATAILAANGGGGGGSDNGTPGEPGQLGITRAAGGMGGASTDADGGQGGGTGGLAGSPGQNDTSAAQSGGGGGGAAGWIRINTYLGIATISPNAVISPGLTSGAASSQMAATE